MCFDAVCVYVVGVESGTTSLSTQILLKYRIGKETLMIVTGALIGAIAAFKLLVWDYFAS